MISDIIIHMLFSFHDLLACVNHDFNYALVLIVHLLLSGQDVSSEQDGSPGQDVRSEHEVRSDRM